MDHSKLTLEELEGLRVLRERIRAANIPASVFRSRMSGVGS